MNVELFVDIETGFYNVRTLFIFKFLGYTVGTEPLLLQNNFTINTEMVKRRSQVIAEYKK